MPSWWVRWPFAVALVERLEDAVDVRGPDADAVVGDREPDLVRSVRGEGDANLAARGP